MLARTDESDVIRLHHRVRELEQALDEAHARIVELELTRPAHTIDLRRACAPGLTHLQATVLAIMCDGRAHTWWGLAETVEMLIGSRSQDQEQLIRTVISRIRSHLRSQGLDGAIAARNRVGYWIDASRLEAVKGLFINR